jgi:hypothetical protein
MERGQTTIEYVGVVGLVGLVMTIASAVAAPDLPRTVAHHVRVGLCIVGGDICRAADARRAGLEPCVTSADSGQGGGGATIAMVSYGRERGFAIERRSDGTRRVLVTADDNGGVSAGVGFRLGPDIDVSAEAGGSIGFASGAAWELPDEAALRRFLKGVKPGPRMGYDLAVRGVRPPTERYRGGSGSVRAGAGLRLLGFDQPLATAHGRGVIGRRTRDGRTSVFMDASHVGPSLFGGLIEEVKVGRPGSWILELGRRPHELRLQTTIPGDGDTRVEIEARLDLAVPENAAVVRDLLARPSPERARAIGRHMLAAGTVERRVYRVRELPGGPDIALKVAFFGGEVSGSEEERTLVAAEVLRDGTTTRRADCLGL